LKSFVQNPTQDKKPDASAFRLIQIVNQRTFVGTTTWAFGTPNVVNPAVNYVGLTAIDTTVSQKLAVSAQFSNAGNSVRLDILTVEIFSSGDVG
jgi:hypothetical protein